MSTKFKNLVKKKKSELVDMADFNSASQLKKAKLIEKLAENPTEKQLDLLDLNAKEVKDKAKEYNLEYTTKKETLSKLSKEIENDEGDESELEQRGSWKEEFNKAIRLAERRSLNDGRSYNVFEVEDEKNTFNVAPAYMKYDEDKNPLLTITIYENLRDKL